MSNSQSISDEISGIEKTLTRNYNDMMYNDVTKNDIVEIQDRLFEILGALQSMNWYLEELETANQDLQQRLDELEK